MSRRDELASGTQRRNIVTTESTPRASAGAKRRPRKKKLTAGERYLKVQEAAYYRAEKDGFRQDAVEYWLAAEDEVGA
jgi:hypothetical protein